MSRNVQFAPSFGANDVKLFEVDEAVLAEILAGSVVIKGTADDEAHLCTRDKTFTLRLAESTNTMLLMPPVADATAPLVVHASVHNVLELKPSAPRMFQLHKLLAQRTYRGPADDAESRRPVYTLAQLESLVQCSDSELRQGLLDAGALAIGPHMRVLDSAYEHRVLDMLLSYALEHGWALDAVPLVEALEVSSGDFVPDVTRHVLLRHGTLLPGGLALRFDPVKLAVFRGETLLRSRPFWLLHEFEAAWLAALPSGDYCGRPALTLLFGRCMVDLKGTHASTIRHFVVEPPPATAEEMFPLLFAARAVWPLDQIMPYITPMATPSLSVDQMLLRYCFVNRVDTKIHTLAAKASRPQRLRVTVDAGGCGGFQYRFKVEPAAADSVAQDDVVLERDGAQVVTDGASLEYLRGAVVDFKVEMMRSGFLVVSNPGAESNCGCGVSFSPKV